MRILVLFGVLLLGGATAADAQQRDTVTRRDTLTRRDSLARRDSAASRADSLLQAEIQRRQGGAPPPRVPPGAVGPSDTLANVSMDTLPVRAIHARIELGAVAGHRLYRSDELETSASLGAAVRGSVEYRFGRGLGTFAMLGGSFARAESRAADVRQGKGSTTQFDVQAGFIWQPPIRRADPEPVTLHVAGGGAWVSGPDEVDPFPQVDDEDQPVPVWEVGLAIRPVRRALAGFAALQMVRILPTTPDVDVWARRLIVGFRLGS